MMFDKADALIVKVSPQRVQELIDSGVGQAFNYTGKPFKEWVLIPTAFESDFESYLLEALDYAKQRAS